MQITDPFSTVSQPAVGESQGIQAVILLILYLIQINFLGSKGIFDPTYLRKCSAGSMLEICKRAGKKTENLCRTWKSLVALLTSIVYLNISGLIVGTLLNVRLPDFYLNILITVFLLTNFLSLSGKVFLNFVLLTKNNLFDQLAIKDVFS